MKTFNLIDRIIPYTVALIAVYMLIILAIMAIQGCTATKGTNSAYQKKVVHKTTRK